MEKNSGGFSKVRPMRPVGAEAGWTIDARVPKTKVGKKRTAQMTAVVTVLTAAEGTPLTFRQVWDRAQKVHHVGDRTVRLHLARMIEDGRVVRMEGPALSPLYLLTGGKLRQWFRCRDCNQLMASDRELPTEIDCGKVEGSYLWGTCRQCEASGVEISRGALGARWPVLPSGGERRRYTHPDEKEE